MTLPPKLRDAIEGKILSGNDPYDFQCGAQALYDILHPQILQLVEALKENQRILILLKGTPSQDEFKSETNLEINRQLSESLFEKNKNALASWREFTGEAGE